MATGKHSLHFVQLGAANFQMGSTSGYPEEGPVHSQAVRAFAIASTPVTNLDFGRFVVATKYQTVAEREQGSMVFRAPPLGVDVEELSWWRFVNRACWHSPDGSASSVVNKANHPVVHICLVDALAYCEWVGCRLPSEVEWEYAASGNAGEPYAWGSELHPDGRVMANHWLGEFPSRPLAENVGGTSPVGSYPANRHGLFDMIGNVWEWTTSEFSDGHGAHACCGSKQGRDPLQQGRDPLQQGGRAMSLKGGSHLCAENYCSRYRPSARIPQPEYLSASHIGFRVASDAS